jgi:hypothetical protein
MSDTGAITGTILAVRDCGSLVLLFLDAEDGRTIPVPMDHRPFRWLLEGQRCSAGPLVGRRVCCEGDSLRFLD